MFWLYFLVIISLSGFSFSQDPNNCTECSIYCPTEPCKHGSKENYLCNCCDECLKGPGESCGGFSLQPGVCASDLYCLPSNLSCQIADLPGTCVKDPSECEICRANYCCKIEETCGVLGSEKHPHCDCCTVCRRPGHCGEFCGGIAAFPCAYGLTCVFEGSLPDERGICQNCIHGYVCEIFLGFKCDEGFTCVRDVSSPYNGGICQKCSPCESCGGIARIECPDGLTCVLEGSYPDARGICKKCSLGDFCGGIDRIECDDEFYCVLNGSYRDAGGICHKDGLGEICGGKAGIEGCDGLTCVLDVSYPDAGGICQICK